MTEQDPLVWKRKDMLYSIPRFPDYCATKDGKIWSKKYKKFLRDRLRGRLGCHYKAVNLNGKNYSVHRIILETFSGLCPKGMQACHNNGIKTDNRIENLRWDTLSNNQKDRRKHGNPAKGSPEGEKGYFVKLTAQQARLIFLAYREGLCTQRELADCFDVSRSAVQAIVEKKNWKCLWES